MLLEKPLGITVKASRELIAAAERKGRILATAENIRRGLSARACRWALAEEQMIGEVPAADVQMVYNGQLNFADPKFKWRGVKLLTGGGMIMDSGAHFTDMMLCLFGEPESVYCEMQTRDPAPIQGAPVVGDAVADVEDTWFAVIRFRNGTRVNWTYSRIQPGPELKFGRYYGPNGTMEDLGNGFHAFQSGGRITLKDGTVRGREWLEGEYQKSLSAGDRERLFPGGATDGFSIEVADFVRAVAGGGRVELDGRAGLAAKALCEACYESATAGKFVAYADVLDGKIDAFQKPINEFWKI